MDSMIRLGLEVLMPIAPTENSKRDIPNTQIENPFNSNSQPRQSTTIDVVQNPDIVDLTTGLCLPQVTSIRPRPNTTSLPSLEQETTPKPISLFNTPIALCQDGEMNGHTNNGFMSPSKHKLSSTTGNINPHHPPKVSRLDDDLRLAAPDSNGNSHYIGTNMPFHTSSHHQRDSPCFPPSVIMRNHTVTSGEGLNLGGASDAIQLNPNWPLLNLQSNYENNIRYPVQVFPKNARPNSNSPVEEGQHTNVNAKQIKTIPVDDDINRKQIKEKETSMFYLLLDMFPDIDLTFLEEQCRFSPDINLVSEIILGMNDYPKYKPNNSATDLTINNPSDIIPRNSTTASYSTNSDSLIMGEVPVTNLLAHPTTSRPNISHDLTPSKSGSTLIPCQTERMELQEGKHKLEVKGNKDVFDKSADKLNGDQSQFNFLMEIFPDADLTFMKAKSKLSKLDLDKFISENMENPNYPKSTNSVKYENAVSDDSAEIGLYTSNFNLGNFLKIFPDPFEYFLDQKRNCKYSEHGYAFLKRRYRCHAIKTINLKYKEYYFNLVKTCEFLDEEKPTRATKRTMQEIRMPQETNLPFLQEACFIEHKTEIKTYLDGVAEAKRLSYEQAETRGELIECGCCYLNVLFEDCATCNEGHLFCKTCVRKSVEVRIGDGHTTFPCLQDCNSVFALQLLEILVDATMFSRLLQRIQLDEVRAADIEGLEVCPFCDFAIILPPETNIFKCLNPECLRESCRKCHRLSHIPQRCEEVENDDQARARKYIEDEMTRALIRVCYKCKKSFIKTDGCNKMTCSCGAKMCYICREPIVDYKHFNGPGGEEKQKCPLYSTEKLLHVDAVKAVAKKALDEVTSKNPELKLKHDPSQILPSAESAKTTLPPGVNEELAVVLNILQNVKQQNDQLFNPQ